MEILGASVGRDPCKKTFACKKSLSTFSDSDIPKTQ